MEENNVIFETFIVGNLNSNNEHFNRACGYFDYYYQALRLAVSLRNTYRWKYADMAETIYSKGELEFRLHNDKGDEILIYIKELPRKDEEEEF